MDGTDKNYDRIRSLLLEVIYIRAITRCCTAKLPT